jgi:hypothetical protein
MQRWMTTCTALAALVAPFALIAGCKGKEASSTAQPDPAARVAPSTAAGAATPGRTAPAGKRAGTPALTAEQVRAEGKALLDRWVAAQNQHDFDAYLAMYEPRHFRGVKRTHRSGVKEFDFAGWKKDRKRMVLGKAEVAAELLDIATWLDPGRKLKPGVSHVRFVQRWRGGGYADHGVKVLFLWRDARGVQRIVYEDLLNSEPGWDRAPAEGIADLALKPPRTEAEALALWQQLAPTGADYEDRLAAIPEDEAVRRPMAVALLGQGDFACEAVVEYEGCGQESVELGPIEPTAGLEQPCLRRRLALWALDELTPDDARTLTDVLVTLVELPEPEDELRQAAFAVAVDDAQRLALLAAAKGKDLDELAEAEAAKLTTIPARIEALRDLHIDAAAQGLDPAAHRDVLLAAVVDTELASDTRRTIMAQLAGDPAPAVTQALVAVADDGDCSLAMEAAELLASRGDPSHLPVRPRSTDASAHLQALCMLAHAADTTRQEAQWLTWFGPDPVLIEEEHYDELAEPAEEPKGEGDEDGADGDDSAVVTQGDGTEIEQVGKTTYTRSRIAGADAASAAYLGEPLATGEGSCAGEECTVEGNTSSGRYTVVFAPAKDGSLYIVALKTYRWSGCLC